MAADDRDVEAIVEKCRANSCQVVVLNSQGDISKRVIETVEQLQREKVELRRIFNGLDTQFYISYAVSPPGGGESNPQSVTPRTEMMVNVMSDELRGAFLETMDAMDRLVEGANRGLQLYVWRDTEGEPMAEAEKWRKALYEDICYLSELADTCTELAGVHAEAFRQLLDRANVTK